MKLKNIYLVFSLLFVPGYIFYIPVTNYIHNFNNITYSLNIPENFINNNKDQTTKYKDIKISDDIPLKKLISESWIISFPDITSEDLTSNFSNDLKKIGITSIISLGSKDNIESIAVGPFIDKKMAENIALKIKNALSYSGSIERLNN